ncbi:MAG: SMC family ATPase [Candidatus Zixiibacteriota bacterium]
MRLVSLDITNFRVIKEAHFEFPDAVIGIIGPNGAGKSSIIEAISWALYGNQVARSGKDEIKATYAAPAENAEVRLTFVLHDQTYTVVRRLIGKTERSEVELLRDGKPESVGSLETKGYVGQLLGLDWRGFLTSFLARQQELNALSDLQPSKRRDHLAGMLGIERLDKGIQRLKEEMKVTEGRKESLERLLPSQETVAARVAFLKEQSVKLYELVLARTQEQAQAEAATTTLTTCFREHEAKKAECSRLTAAIDGARKGREHLSEQYQGLTSQKQQMIESRSALETLAPSLAQLPIVTVELENLKQAKARAALKTELATQHVRSEQDRQLVVGKLQTLQTEISRLDQERQGLVPELDKKLAEGKQQLEQAREQFAKLNGRVEAHAAEIGKLKKQVVSIDRIGPDTVCDRCRRPYGNDLPMIKAHLEAELAETLKAERTMRAELETLKGSGKVLKGQVEDWERQSKRRFEIEVKLTSLWAEESTLAERLRQLIDELERLQRRLLEIGEVTFDARQFATVEARLKQLESARQEHDRLAGFVSHLGKVEADIVEVAEKLRVADADLKRQQEDLTKVGFDETAFALAARQLEDAQKKLENARAGQIAVSRDLELARQELADKEEELVRLEAAQKELEACRDGLYYGVKLGGLLTEFRELLIARIRPRLGEIAGQLIDEMTDGRYNLIELDEEYNIRILDTGQFFGIDRFSGGEKDLANLCLRLAISLSLTEAAGLSSSFVILDEVFASQDDIRRELILKGLSGLKNRFPQILLITHIPEIKDRVEVLYDVLPTGLGWSDVRRNGSRA